VGLSGAGRWTLDVLTWRAFLGHTVVYCSGSVLARFAVGQPLSQKLMRGWCAGVVRQVGMRIESDGLERLQGPPRVLVSNHLSALDIPVIGSQLPIDYRWVAKSTLFRMPFLGWHLWASGHIPVDRRRLGNLDRMQAQVRDVLSVGGSVLFFAEGTRSRDGALQRFKNGAFATAVAESVPVQPIVVDGTEKLLVKGSIRFPEAPDRPVRLRVLDPVVPDAGEPGAVAEDLRDRVRAAMVDALDELRGGTGRAETPTLASPAG
jgi:1-acyl-sn-glycerol-3-phosphate acyltransferase